MATNYGTGVIAECTDGQSPKFDTRYFDGNRPSISGVTGTIANGETITINGVFSAKRNGDAWNWLDKAVGTAPVTGYTVTAGDDFIGSGKYLLAVKPQNGNSWLGLSAPTISIGDHNECYYSCLRKTVVHNWGTDTDNLQIKFERPVVKIGGHVGGIDSILSGWVPSEDGLTANLSGGIFQSNWRTDTASAYGQPQGTNTHKHFDNWNRIFGYYKSDTDGKRNGSVFKAIKTEATKEIFFDFIGGGKNANDTRFGTPINPFFEPRYTAYCRDDVLPDGIGQEFWLPFYTGENVALDMYYAGLIINTSPESLWVIAGSNITSALATGKAVQLPQSSRIESEIKATLFLGDMTTDDDIYITAMNSNGRFSDPYLLRAAS